MRPLLASARQTKLKLRKSALLQQRVMLHSDGRKQALSFLFPLSDHFTYLASSVTAHQCEQSSRSSLKPF